MQASPRVAGAPQKLVPLTVATIDAGRRLVVPDDQWLVPWPQPPVTWTIVPDSRSANAGERFLAYAYRDVIVTMRAVRGVEPEPAGRAIAMMTLGPRRVSIADCGPGRFDARWTCDDFSMRLTVAPTTLAGLMKVLLTVGWR